MGIIERVIPRPRTCFMLTLILVLLAGAMATSSFVLRKRLDALGNVMMDPNGQPMFEVDQWASFWKGWPSNIPWVLAQFFVVLGIVLWIRGKYVAAKSHHQESKKPAQQAGSYHGG
jgi:hypothetical protein